MHSYLYGRVKLPTKAFIYQTNWEVDAWVLQTVKFKKASYLDMIDYISM